MKRKKLVLAVSAAVLLGGYTVGIFGQTEGDLTQKQIDNPKIKKKLPEACWNPQGAADSMTCGIWEM